MSNFVMNEDTVAFHPGYYIQEFMEENELSQEDFAEQLGLASEKLNMLVQGENNVSAEIAKALSNTMGTSEVYWINHQKAYDSIVKK